jgi:hypothetical protein
MNRRPSYEPTRNFRPSPRLQDDAQRNARWLGCLGCPDFKVCGGLHTEADIFDCDDLCSCADQEACDMVCRRKPLAFFERLMEIGGFDLETTPRVAPVVASSLPDHVPFIGHKYSRIQTLAALVVAVPLYEIFHMGTGEPHVGSRAELAKRFLIADDALVIATGVDRDFKVERWWEFPDRAKVMRALRDLGIALVTTPNFSLFTNVPRPDNLHGMKRIALSWAELMAAGIPAALHLNARTDFDYARWTQFVAARPEVEIVAFEFGTGAGYPNRIEWHVERLCALADAAGRPLRLVLRGGVRMLPRLRTAFAQVILIETEAFSRALKRRRATITEAGRLRWLRTPTPKGEPIDALLAHNIATVRSALSSPAPVARDISRPERGAVRRQTANADHQPAQPSFMAELDASLQTGTVTANSKRVIVAAEA